MSFDAFKDQINEIEIAAISSEKMANFKSEDDFVGIAVELLKEVGSYACVAASLLPQSGFWDRDQAIIGGHMVRLFKLISAILDQTCQHRRETSFIFARLAFETIINANYLIKNKTPELYDSYVRYSMRHERKLYSRIMANIKNRNGVVLPIEHRMIASLERTAAESKVGLEEDSEPLPKNWGDKNLYEKAQQVGLGDTYLGTFGGGSHTVHGNWMDLLEYHLDTSPQGFAPELRWHPPRPQPLFVISLLAADVVRSYFDSFEMEAISGITRENIGDLLNRIDLADTAHEKFLSERAQ